jgi:predicted DNA-binding transcriptional regulator AlpA
MPELELMGLYEVAEYLGISRSAVKSRLEATNGVTFPPPLATLRCGPIWEKAAIEQYRNARRAAGPSAPYRWTIERRKRQAPIRRQEQE